MDRFFIPGKSIANKSVTFPEEISHQIRNVLRLIEGDQVEVAFGDGWIHTVSLTSIRKDRVEGLINERRRSKTDPAIQLNLLFPLSNRDKVEWILQKATEIGVYGFHPYVSQRTLIQKTETNQKKYARWLNIIREAAEQSKRGILPELHQPGRLFKILDELKNNSVLAEDIHAEDQDLKSLTSIQNHSDPIYLITGPEGGFATEEKSKLASFGVEFFSMGKRILRMETAAIVAPALILYALGEMDVLE